MMIPLHRRPSLLLLLFALGGCPAADDAVEPPEETGDETGEAEAMPHTLSSWSDAAFVPTMMRQLAAFEDTVYAITLDGFFSYQDGTWTDLDRASSVFAVEDAVAIQTTSGIYLRQRGESDFSLTELDATLARSGDSGIYGRSSGRAVQLWPEQRDIGYAHEAFDTSCASQVRDDTLHTFSFAEGEWVSIALPEPGARIFEFAVSGQKRWLFGESSMWRSASEGDDWSAEQSLPDLIFDQSVVQHGNTILTQLDNGVGWTMDDGESWSVVESVGEWHTAGGQLYFESLEQLELRRVDLMVGPESIETVAELPPTVIEHPLLSLAGTPILTSFRDLSLHAPEGPQYFETEISAAFIPVVDAVLTPDGAGVWLAHRIAHPSYQGTFAPPTRTNLGSSAYPNRWDGWPSGYGSSALAMTPDGIAACAVLAGSEEGGGVYRQRDAQTNWTRVGSDFPQFDSAPASCIGLFGVGDALIASTNQGSVRLDGDSWRPLEGASGLTALVETSSGWWGLAPDGLLFSEDGDRFELADESLAGALDLHAEGDTLIALSDGELLTGWPGSWTRVAGPAPLLALDVRDGRVLATTEERRAVLATLE